MPGLGYDAHVVHEHVLFLGDYRAASTVPRLEDLKGVWRMTHLE